ncbi:MAG: response regulator, partial [Candidatus Cloacimonetes bacterium]|nr:response regulator [Candidatus Cloacimonadota bacterium]
MNSKNILLVEDNPSDIELTQRAMEKSKIENQLVVKEDGAEALKYLFEECGNPGFDPLPALILLDLDLPEVNGMEVLRRVR